MHTAHNGRDVYLLTELYLDQRAKNMKLINTVKPYYPIAVIPLLQPTRKHSNIRSDFLAEPVNKH